MGTNDDEAGTTRQRVLESACRLFAEKGYRDTTVHEICEQASANIAAVNYYFRDKETLYVEALRHAAAVALEAYPIGGGLPPDAPGAERLRAHVAANVRRIFCEGPPSYFLQMQVKEMAEPTPAHRTVIKDIMRPFRHHMEGLLRELLGRGVDAKTRRLCAASTISQFLFLAFHHLARDRVLKGPHRGARPTEEELVNHITLFSLAGIRAVREAAQQGRKSTASTRRS